MSRSHLAVALAARDLIAEPEHWTQGEFARDIFGAALGWEGFPYRRDADSWCMEGAMCAVGGAWMTELEAMLCRIVGVPAGTLGQWQDKPEREHAEVLAAFDQLITELEEVAA